DEEEEEDEDEDAAAAAGRRRSGAAPGTGKLAQYVRTWRCSVVVQATAFAASFRRVPWPIFDKSLLVIACCSLDDANNAGTAGCVAFCANQNTGGNNGAWLGPPAHALAKHARGPCSSGANVSASLQNSS
ncbi:unnamed protein product, partial [Prorocentrum cordatum]